MARTRLLPSKRSVRVVDHKASLGVQISEIPASGRPAGVESEALPGSADPPPAGAGRLKPGVADWPLHPFLFGAYSVLSLYASNLREIGFSSVVVPLGVVTTAALGLFAAFGLALRRFGPRSAIMASIVMVGILFYADLAAWFGRLSGGALPAAARLPIVAAAALLLLVVVALAPVRLSLPNAALNGIALVLLANPAWLAVAYEWNVFRGDPPEVARAFAEDASRYPADKGIPAGLPAPAARPDIYYVIFDRYASQAVLHDEFGFDNQPLVDFLGENGFYVAPQSVSNYLKTAPSLASSLHMDYIDFLADGERTRRSDWHPIYRMLAESRVARFVKARGYEFIQIGSWWGPTQANAAADEIYSFGFTEFEWLLLRETILPPLVDLVAPGSQASARMRWDNAQCHRVPRQIEQIKRTADRPEPTFTFVHLLLPHEPFVFDDAGRCLSLEEMGKRGFRDGYVGQVRYANTLIRDFVADLLARDGVKPLIIIQADEGPFPDRYRTGSRSWRDASAAEFRMKTGILNAYFFPNGDYSELSAGITPVNSFRAGFNNLFATDFERLPDSVFATPDTFELYEFFDVTGLAKPGTHDFRAPDSQQR